MVISRIIKPFLKCQNGLKRAEWTSNIQQELCNTLNPDEGQSIIKQTDSAFDWIGDMDPWKSLAELTAPDTLSSRIYGLIIRH